MILLTVVQNFFIDSYFYYYNDLYWTPTFLHWDYHHLMFIFENFFVLFMDKCINYTSEGLIVPDAVGQIEKK